MFDTHILIVGAQLAPLCLFRLFDEVVDVFASRAQVRYLDYHWLGFQKTNERAEEQNIMYSYPVQSPSPTGAIIAWAAILKFLFL